MAAEIIPTDPVILLPESQKTCLRLVGQGMSSKEIAKVTGLSPQTVDTYLKAAMSRLGATNRRQAARMLLTVELSQKMGSPTTRLAGTLNLTTHDASKPRGSRVASLIAYARLPPIGGQFNELSWADRNYAIFRVGAFGLGIVIALVLVIAGMLWILE